MAARKFSMIAPALWRSKRFRALPGTDAQLFYLYTLTSEHMNSAGCFRLPDAYAASDLGWTEDRVETARLANVDGDMLVHDSETEEYFILRWFKHCPPMNKSHRQGTERLMSEIESDHVREATEADYAAHVPPTTENVHDLSGRLTGSNFMTRAGRGN